MDFNTIFNIVVTAILGYITWTFKEKDTRTESRFKGIETQQKETNKEINDIEKKFYRDFVTREQHDMDINALMKKMDENNRILLEVYKDIGKLIGREKLNG